LSQSYGPCGAENSGAAADDFPLELRALEGTAEDRHDAALALRRLADRNRPAKTGRGVQDDFECRRNGDIPDFFLGGVSLFEPMYFAS